MKFRTSLEIEGLYTISGMYATFKPGLSNLKTS